MFGLPPCFWSKGLTATPGSCARAVPATRSKAGRTRGRSIEVSRMGSRKTPPLGRHGATCVRCTLGQTGPFRVWLAVPAVARLRLSATIVGYDCRLRLSATIVGYDLTLQQAGPPHPFP